MNRTSIEWTDFSANPLKYRNVAGDVVWGCAKVSQGCTNCYAEALAHRYRRGGPFNVAEMQKLTPFLDEHALRRMLTYKPAAGMRCFIGDMTDIFGAWVPDEVLDRLFAVVALRQDVTWQVLTKRADRLRAYMGHSEREARWMNATAAVLQHFDPGGDRPILRRRDPLLPLPNVWIGVSAEDQMAADARIPDLLLTPAAIRFLSAEPIVGPINLGLHLGVPLADGSRWGGSMPLLDWVIIGGENGPRVCDLAWIDSLAQQCASAGVPYFVKQLGRWPLSARNENLHGGRGWVELEDGDGVRRGEYGLDASRARKGSDMAQWPTRLRVRQFPEAA